MSVCDFISTSVSQTAPENSLWAVILLYALGKFLLAFLSKEIKNGKALCSNSGAVTVATAATTPAAAMLHKTIPNGMSALSSMIDPLPPYHFYL